MVMRPSITWGSDSAQAWNPNNRIDSACGTRNPDSLSSVMLAEGSIAPVSRAPQLSDMLFAALA